MTVNEGATPSFSVDAYDCYVISDINVGGTHIQAGGQHYTYTYPAVYSDSTITATFTLGAADHSPIHLMTPLTSSIGIAVDGTGYTVTNLGNVVACVTSNEPHSFYATVNSMDPYFGSPPDYTCHFDHWELRNSSNQLIGTSTTNPMTYTPTATTYLTAHYTAGAASTYSLSASASSGGTIIPNGTLEVAGSSTAMVLMKPNSGYHLADLTCNGNSVMGSVSNNQYSATNIGSNLTFYASFSNQCTLTTGIGSGQGSVSPSSGLYDNGANVTLSATPASGYRFDHWTVVNASGSNSYTTATTNVTITSDTTATAYFIRQYTITINHGTGGTTSPGTQVVDTGTTVHIVATPNTGYVFNKLNIAGTDYYLYSQRDVTVTSDITCTAYFTQQFSWSCTTSNANQGTVSSNTANGYVAPNTHITMDATPAAGYHFAYWLANEQVYDYNQHEEFNIAADVSMVAYFAVNTYTVSTSATADVAITGSQTVNGGTSPVVSWQCADDYGSYYCYITEVIVDGASHNPTEYGSANAGSITFNTIQSAHSVVVHSAPYYYPVTFNVYAHNDYCGDMLVNSTEYRVAWEERDGPNYCHGSDLHGGGPVSQYVDYSINDPWGWGTDYFSYAYIPNWGGGSEQWCYSIPFDVWTFVWGNTVNIYYNWQG